MLEAGGVPKLHIGVAVAPFPAVHLVQRNCEEATKDYVFLNDDSDFHPRHIDAKDTGNSCFNIQSECLRNHMHTLSYYPTDRRPCRPQTA